MNTLSNRRYLVISSTMQSLCLDNNKRKEAMNGYFLNTADSNIIQSPVTFESTKKALNRGAPVIEDFPFLSFGELPLFVSSSCQLD